MILNKQQFYSILHQGTQVSVPLKPGEQKLEGTHTSIAIVMWYSFEHDWLACKATLANFLSCWDVTKAAVVANFVFQKCLYVVLLYCCATKGADKV